ncbi:MAG: CDP-alcohol phosphatidyltransferase family protein [Candidatus Kerfeldbacteria bacterium]|nr:CDP-alcohol phosphatidyltransferase family protein [Candidatus Kerfeldbacteria bacterium]
MLYRWIANSITVARIALVIAAMMAIAADDLPRAFWVLAIAILTDWIDGPIARLSPGESHLGKFLESLADSLLVFLPLIALGIWSPLPFTVFLVYGIVGLALMLVRIGALGFKRARLAAFIHFTQLIYLKIFGELGIMIYLSRFVHPLLWIGVLAVYGLFAVIKRKRLQGFAGWLYATEDRLF